MSEKEAVLSLNNEELASKKLTTMEKIKNKLYAGGQITKEEAMGLIEAPLDELCAAANEVREHFCGNVFDVCTIINGKSGKCSENCKFCSQSRYYRTKVDAYSLIGSETIVEQAKYNEERGVLRYSIVTSGRALSSQEVDKVCESLQAVQKESDIALCGSFGLLEEKEFAKLKQAGLTRVHNNLETSRRNFPNVCTTHTYDDKIAAIRAAQQAGSDRLQRWHHRLGRDDGGPHRYGHRPARNGNPLDPCQPVESHPRHAIRGKRSRQRRGDEPHHRDFPATGSRCLYPVGRRKGPACG